MPHLNNKMFLSIAILTASLACALPACTATRPDVVPAAAMETSSGRGDLIYVAGDRGTIYIYDQTWNQLVYSGPVDRRQEIKIDTMAGRVTVDGKTVTEHPVGHDDQFRIFIDRDTPTRVSELPR